MISYVYETIPSSAGLKPEYFEIMQAESEAPLSKHPQTGQAIRRVVIAGHGALASMPSEASKPSKDKGGCGCGPKGCC